MLYQFHIFKMLLAFLAQNASTGAKSFETDGTCIEIVLHSPIKQN